MTITRIQGNAAGDLVRTIRPSWDALTTANVIIELAETMPFERVMLAAVKAATNPDNRSPLSIRWQEIPGEDRTGKYSHEPRCEICLLRKTRCRYVAEKTGDRHEYVAEDNTQPDPD